MSDNVMTALIGALSGGLGIAIVNKFFGQKSEELKDAAQIRAEMWKEIHDLRNQAAIDRAAHQQCQRDLASLGRKYDELKDQNGDLRRRVADLERRTA